MWVDVFMHHSTWELSSSNLRILNIMEHHAGHSSSLSYLQFSENNIDNNFFSLGIVNIPLDIIKSSVDIEVSLDILNVSHRYIYTVYSESFTIAMDWRLYHVMSATFDVPGVSYHV
jgi:hypothetical protein